MRRAFNIIHPRLVIVTIVFMGFLVLNLYLAHRPLRDISRTTKPVVQHYIHNRTSLTKRSRVTPLPRELEHVLLEQEPDSPPLSQAVLVRSETRADVLRKDKTYHYLLNGRLVHAISYHGYPFAVRLKNVVSRPPPWFADDAIQEERYLLPPPEDIQIRDQTITRGNRTWVAPMRHIREHPQYMGVFMNAFTCTFVLYVSVFIPLLIRDAIRAHQRRERGRCINCNYDITGLSNCPECGS